MYIKNFNEIDLNKVIKTVNLIAPAKNAKLGPPVGPILGQVKIKVKDFCTLFNNVSNNFEEDFPVRVKVFVLKNETFCFLIQTPSIYFLLKNFINFNKKSSLSLLDIYKISKIKQVDLNYLSMKIIFKNVLNCAKINNINVYI